MSHRRSVGRRLQLKNMHDLIINLRSNTQEARTKIAKPIKHLVGPSHDQSRNEYVRVVGLVQRLVLWLCVASKRASKLLGAHVGTAKCSDLQCKNLFCADRVFASIVGPTLTLPLFQCLVAVSHIGLVINALQNPHPDPPPVP
eukprot:5086815-Amphidinium_carterae.1